MSFDVFLQAFRDEDAAGVDSAVVLRELSRFTTEPVTRGTERISTADGEAQIYLNDPDSGFMVNHASGDVIWDALVHVAHVTGMVILPVGCPTCVPSQELIGHLPDVLREQTRIVTSGEQLVAAFNP